MSRREFYIAALLIALASAAWYWAGWAAGRAKYDELRSLGCKITCGYRT
jgi:hypothetical protein